MPTRTVQSELLQDVLDEPDNDEPRLIYADFLDDKGDHDRAEFIRLQIAVSQIKHPPDRPTKPMMLSGWLHAQHIEKMVLSNSEEEHHPCEWCMKNRIGELLRQGYFTWSPFSHAFHKKNHRAIGYSRGFVSSLNIPVDELMKHGKRVARKCPIEEIRLTYSEPVEIGGVWNWMIGKPEPESPWFLPVQLWDLVELLLVGIPGVNAKYANSEDDAIEELHKACLKFCRGK